MTATSDLDEAEVRALRASGMTWTEIAGCLGVAPVPFLAWRAARGMNDGTRIRHGGRKQSDAPPRPRVFNPDAAFARLMRGLAFRDADVPPRAIGKLASPDTARSLTGCAAAECTR